MIQVLVWNVRWNAYHLCSWNSLDLGRVCLRLSCLRCWFHIDRQQCLLGMLGVGYWLCLHMIVGGVLIVFLGFLFKDCLEWNIVITIWWNEVVFLLRWIGCQMRLVVLMGGLVIGWIWGKEWLDWLFQDRGKSLMMQTWLWLVRCFIGILLFEGWLVHIHLFLWEYWLGMFIDCCLI